MTIEWKIYKIISLYIWQIAFFVILCKHIKVKEGDVVATVETLDKIRVTLKKHLGKKIVLKANKGRKQVVTKVGVLENVYPSVFVVKLGGTSDGNQRVSYSYSDLLTANVKLQICRNTKKDDTLSAS